MAYYTTADCLELQGECLAAVEMLFSSGFLPIEVAKSYRNVFSERIPNEDIHCEQKYIFMYGYLKTLAEDYVSKISAKFKDLNYMGKSISYNENVDAYKNIKTACEEFNMSLNHLNNYKHSLMDLHGREFNCYIDITLPKINMSTGKLKDCKCTLSINKLSERAYLSLCNDLPLMRIDICETVYHKYRGCCLLCHKYIGNETFLNDIEIVGYKYRVVEPNEEGSTYSLIVSVDLSQKGE